MQSSATPESAPAPAEGMSSYSPQSTQGRPAPRQPEPAQIASVLQQQGMLPPGINPADPNAQAHILHLLHQLGGAPNTWANSSQQAASHNLENLLSQISRQPELAASLPGLLNTLTAGGLNAAQFQAKAMESAQGDVGQATYTAQLYGAPNAGLGDSDLKHESGELQGLDDDSKLSSVKCAKEKNRQAQRRFRERQKGLISNLKESRDALQKQVEEQRRQIEQLEKENNIMRVLIEGKGKQ